MNDFLGYDLADLLTLESKDSITKSHKMSTLEKVVFVIKVRSRNQERIKLWSKYKNAINW